MRSDLDYKKNHLLSGQNIKVIKGALLMGKLKHLKFKFLEHPDYSPDLAPTDIHLLPNLKKYLAGKRFGILLLVK